ncbi:STAS-like domain-containing protein [Lentzea rhizosphaerae]|uniref:STAS-like domain-containing protein n=1 Tax=Lentzea rhizosphaerae TaxID=2041025 RepID=A0ABV8C7I3_9PSEU
MTRAVVFNVVQLGEFPATRSKARDGRNRLEDILAGKTGVDLTIDFTGVTAMTISFADEFLGKFLTSLDATSQELTLKVTGLNTENAEAVTICLERREAQVAVLDSDGILKLDGAPPLPETFDTAVELGEFKANDLAQRLNISPQNANNRLKRLAAVGALRKTRTIGASRGGKEFSYATVTARVPDTDGLSMEVPLTHS